jgi:ribonuclease Z
MKRIMVALLALGTSFVLQGQTTTPPPIIRVTLLGTGVPLLNATALAANGRALSGLLVEAGTERMLFDCGQGVYTRLVQSGPGLIPNANPNIGVDKVFLSHLHSDHMGDLGPLFGVGGLYRYVDPINGAAADLPLKVWGPGGGPNQPVPTFAIMQSFRLAFDTDIYVRQLFTNPNDFSVTNAAFETINSTIELWPDVVYSNNGVKVTAFLVDHHPMAPSYGFRVDYQGKSFVYSGDTTLSPELINQAKGVDLLVHEVYGYPRAAGPEIYDYHTSPEDAAKVFNQAAPKNVVFTHLVIPPGTTANDLVARTRAAGYSGPLTPGLDLMQINITATGSTIVAPTGATSINDEPATSDYLEIGRRRMKGQ